MFLHRSVPSASLIFRRGDIVDEFSGAIGETFQNYRKKCGLSQEVVSGLIGLDRNLYRRIERGEKVPTVRTLLLIAEVFHVSPQTLLASIEEEIDSRGGLSV